MSSQLVPVEHIALTTTQRDSLASPAVGTTIFNSTTGRTEIYNGSAWRGALSVENALSELTPVAATVRANIGAAAAGIISNFRFSELWELTHSYGDGGATGPTDRFNSYPRKFAANTSIPIDNIDIWTRSGMLGYDPHTGDLGTAAGVGGVFRFSYPSHVFGAPGSTGAIQSSRARGSLDLIDLGLNDAVYYFNDSNVLPAYKHSLRAVTAWRRLRAYFGPGDASWARTGTWSAGAALPYIPQKGYEQSSTLDDYAEFTIPAGYLGGPIDLFMLGNPNTQTTLAAAINTTDTTGGCQVTANDFLPQSGDYDVIIGTEIIRVTAQAGTGGKTLTMVARGQFGTVAATHANASTVRRPTATAYLDFTGSTANIDGAGAGVAPVSVRGFDSAGHYIIAGQGATGCDVFMVARLTGLTAADAGLKIRAQLKNVAPGETFRPFAWGIEDTEPQPMIYIDQPKFYTGNTLGSLGEAASYLFNNAMSDLTAEFTKCYKTTLATTFAEQFEATIQTATGTGESSIKVTPVDADKNVWSKGSVLRCATEEFLVNGAIDKTNAGANDGTWIVPVQNNYSGDSAGFATAATQGNVNHAVGKPIYDCRAFRASDRIHLSDIGSDMYAAALGVLAGTISRTTTELVRGDGYRRPNQSQGWMNGLYLGHPSAGVSGTITTKATTLNKEIAYPIELPFDCNILSLSARVTTVSANGVVRFGIYTDGWGCPGYLIYDAGTAPTTGLGLTTVTLFVPRIRGIIWVSYTSQTAVATFAAVATNSAPPVYHIPRTATNITTNNGISVACSRTGMTGALTDWNGTSQGAEADGYAYEANNINIVEVYMGLEKFRTGY